MSVLKTKPVRAQDQTSFILCICLLAFSSVQCSRDNDRAYSRGSTVIVAYADEAFGLDSNAARFLLFLPLVTLDEHGKLVGRLARSWEHSPDYREWTYHLRTDVRWHDGVPVTAHDVKFTLELLSHPEVLEIAPGAIESITVIDDYTITVRGTRWHKPDDDELLYWEVYYPKHLLQHLDPKEANAWEFWTHPVGNGPYRFVRYLPETMMEFEANPDYYRGKPRIERVVLKFTGRAGPGLTELLSGNVDAVDVKWRQIPRLAADPRFRVYYVNWLGECSAIFWQHDHPLLGDPRVRRALTLAIDRSELLQMLNLPKDLPLFDGVYTSRQFRRSQLPEQLPYDPAQAKHLLETAGWRDTDGDGVRDRDGQAFRFTALVNASWGEYEAIALYVQDQLRRVGVHMEIQAMEVSMVKKRMETGKFEAAFTGLRFSLFLQRLFTRWQLGYQNDEVVELIDRLMVTANPDAADHIYRRLSEIFRTDLPVTFLFPAVGTQVVHRRIRGMSSPWRGGVLSSMEDLWLEDEQQ